MSARVRVPPFLLLLVVTELTVMAAHAARPIVTYRAIDLGASPVEIGLVQSAFAVLPLVTAVGLGHWVDRVGEARIIGLGAVAIAGGAILGALSPSLVVLAAGQVVMGFGLMASAIAIQALVANRGSRAGRIHRFGWHAVAVSVGQLAGPGLGAAIVVLTTGTAATGGGLSGTEAAPVFVLAALAGAAAVGLAVVLSGPGPGAGREAARHPGGTDGPAARPTSRILAASLTVLYRPGMRSAMFVSIVVTAAIDIFIAYLPAYGSANGIGVGTVGALLAVRAGASLVSRVLMGRLSELLGLDRLLILSTSLAGAAILLLPFVGDVGQLFGLMVVIGLGLGVGQPLTIAWVADQSRPEERGLALGVRLTGNLGALLVVPTAMGFIAGVTGIGAIWIAVAILLGLAAVVALRAPLHRTSEEIEVEDLPSPA